MMFFTFAWYMICCDADSINTSEAGCCTNCILHQPQSQPRARKEEKSLILPHLGLKLFLTNVLYLYQYTLPHPGLRHFLPNVWYLYQYILPHQGLKVYVFVFSSSILIALMHEEHISSWNSQKSTEFTQFTQLMLLNATRTTSWYLNNCDK